MPLVFSVNVVAVSDQSVLDLSWHPAYNQRSRAVGSSMEFESGLVFTSSEGGAEPLGWRDTNSVEDAMVSHQLPF